MWDPIWVILCSYLLASKLLEYPNLVPDLSIPILMVKTLFLLLWIPFTGEFHPVNLFGKSLDVFPHRLQVLSGRVVIPRIRYEAAGAAADSSVDWFSGKP